MSKPVIFVRDWKDEYDWSKINEKLRSWEGPMIFHNVDTDSDSCAFVIANEELHCADVASIYRDYANQ